MVTAWIILAIIAIAIIALLVILVTKAGEFLGLLLDGCDPSPED